MSEVSAWVVELAYTCGLSPYARTELMVEAIDKYGINRIEVHAKCTKCGKLFTEKLSNWFGHRYCTCPGKEKTVRIAKFRVCQ